MPLVCSRCSKLYESGSACPRCGAPSPTSFHEATRRGHGPVWQQTTWGRIFIGLVLAQGLFYGLRHLITGVMLAFRDSSDDELWTDPRNALVLLSLQLATVFFGGLLAGGGQRFGFFLGALTGIWNGILSTVFNQQISPVLWAPELFAGLASISFLIQPVVQSVCGTLGGLLGSLIWQPVKPSAASDLPSARKPVTPKGPPLLAGRIAWIRVLIATGCVVAGTLGAPALFQKILAVGGTSIAATTDFQDLLITWQIKAMLVFLGAAVSGATTTNGFKQGLIVGLLASGILIGMQANRTTDMLGMIAYTIIGTVSLSIFGGWFGGQLLPPVLKVKRIASGMPSW